MIHGLAAAGPFPLLLSLATTGGGRRKAARPPGRVVARICPPVSRRGSGAGWGPWVVVRPRLQPAASLVLAAPLATRVARRRRVVAVGRGGREGARPGSDASASNPFSCPGCQHRVCARGGEDMGPREIQGWLFRPRRWRRLRAPSPSLEASDRSDPPTPPSPSSPGRKPQLCWAAAAPSASYPS